MLVVSFVVIKLDLHLLRVKLLLMRDQGSGSQGLKAVGVISFFLQIFSVE